MLLGRSRNEATVDVCAPPHPILTALHKIGDCSMSKKRRGVGYYCHVHDQHSKFVGDWGTHGGDHPYGNRIICSSKW